MDGTRPDGACPFCGNTMTLGMHAKQVYPDSAEKTRRFIGRCAPKSTVCVPCEIEFPASCSNCLTYAPTAGWYASQVSTNVNTGNRSIDVGDRYYSSEGPGDGIVSLVDMVDSDTPICPDCENTID